MTRQEPGILGAVGIFQRQDELLGEIRYSVASATSRDLLLHQPAADIRVPPIVPEWEDGGV